MAAAQEQEQIQRLAQIEMWRGDLRVLLRVLQDSRTPWYASALMAGVLLWGLLPVDPLPDIVPLAGIIDDAGVFLIIRAAIYRLVPNEIVDQHAEVIANTKKHRFGPAKAVASIAVLQVVLIVVVLGAFGAMVF
ncbi:MULTISPECIES: YkvA family protein [Haloferax]|nr:MULTISPECIES: DUF1232 domain-containing protein [Haloferax]